MLASGLEVSLITKSLPFLLALATSAAAFAARTDSPGQLSPPPAPTQKAKGAAGKAAQEALAAARKAADEPRLRPSKAR